MHSSSSCALWFTDASCCSGHCHGLSHLGHLSGAGFLVFTSSRIYITFFPSPLEFQHFVDWLLTANWIEPPQPAKKTHHLIYIYHNNISYPTTILYYILVTLKNLCTRKIRILSAWLQRFSHPPAEVCTGAKLCVDHWNFCTTPSVASNSRRSRNRQHQWGKSD